MQVYADNAATTRMHQTAIDTMTYHLNNITPIASPFSTKSSSA